MQDFEVTPNSEVTKNNQNGTEVIQRPPGALDADALADVCTGCGDCVAVCPAALILLDKDYLPVVVSLNLCGECGLCADVCSYAAIQFTPETRKGLDLIMSAQRKADQLENHGAAA